MPAGRLIWQGQLAPAAEVGNDGSVVSRFVYASRVNVPDLIIRSGQVYRVLHDHLGSPRLVVNSSTGSVVQHVDIDEWGIVAADTSPGWQPFGFAGGLAGAAQLLDASAHMIGSCQFGFSLICGFSNSACGSKVL